MSEPCSPIKSTWNRESVFDERIAPLMAQVAALCIEHDLPFVALVQYSSDAASGESAHSTTLLVPRGTADPLMHFIGAMASPAFRHRLMLMLLEGGKIDICAASATDAPEPAPTLDGSKN